MSIDVRAEKTPAPAEFASRMDPLVVAIAALIVVVSIFPRSAAALVLALLAASAVYAAIRGQLGEAVRRPLTPLVWTALAFTGWSMGSALWSADPMASLTKPLYLLASVIGLTVAAGVFPSIGRPALSRLANGLLIGVLVGGVIVAIESVTDQALTKFFYNTFPSLQKGLAKQLTLENGLVTFIQPNNINRRATVITLLLVPAALAALLSMSPALRRWTLPAVLLIAATILGFSTHQSSQAAIAAAGLAFVLCRQWPKAAIGLVGAAWCASCLLVIPLVTSLHATGIHNQPNKLFFSARHRIVIWNYTAEQVKKAPLIGVGADATAALNEAWSKELAKSGVPSDLKDGEFTQTTARHAHNVYLQVWYELGAIGAVLLTLFGLGALVAIWRAPAGIRPYFLAEFAAIAAMVAFSFSIWQVWLQASIAAGILALLVTTELKRAREANA